MKKIMALNSLKIENGKSIPEFSLELKVKQEKVCQAKDSPQMFADRLNLFVDNMFNKYFKKKNDNYIAIQSVSFTHYNTGIVMNVLANEYSSVKCTSLFKK